MEVVLPELLDAALGGDAIVVAVSSRAVSGYSGAVKVFFRERARIKPEKELVEVYNRYYSLYERLVETLNEYFKEVSQISEVPATTPAWDAERLVHLLFKLES